MRPWLRPKPLTAPASCGVLVLRLVVGLAFMYHGYGKIQSPLSWMGPESHTPAFLQALAALSEFGGGLAWMLGLLTPIASLGIACTMVEAVRLHAFVLKHPFVSPTGGGSYELAAVFLAVALLLLLGGPGKYSLDHRLFADKGRVAMPA